MLQYDNGAYAPSWGTPFTDNLLTTPKSWTHPGATVVPKISPHFISRIRLWLLSLDMQLLHLAETQNSIFCYNRVAPDLHKITIGKTNLCFKRSLLHLTMEQRGVRLSDARLPSTRSSVLSHMGKMPHCFLDMQREDLPISGHLLLTLFNPWATWSPPTTQLTGIISDNKDHGGHLCLC